MLTRVCHSSKVMAILLTKNENNMRCDSGFYLCEFWKMLPDDGVDHVSSICSKFNTLIIMDGWMDLFIYWPAGICCGIF